MLVKAKEFVVTHKKGIAIAAGVATVSVIAYKMYHNQSADDVNGIAEDALELAHQDAHLQEVAASVYQA